jgi:predicted HAD superfamily Cof-like phosphohydrolase
MSVLDMMTPEQRERAMESMAMMQCKKLRFSLGEHPVRMAGHFHLLMGIPIAEDPVIPSVTDRLLRGQLLLEEVIETFTAMGLRLRLEYPDDVRGEGDCLLPDDSKMMGHLVLDHVEGSRYDVVETADGLSDINFIVGGTAAQFGIPLHATDYEVYSSNLTKLRPDGTPIINGVTEGYRQLDMMDAEPGFRSDLPIGKVLKPEGFVPANIPAVLAAIEREEF